MRKLLSGIFFLLFIATVAAFIGGLASTVINPKYFWPFAFIGLAFPFIFIVLCGFFLYWLFTKNKKVLYPFFLLLLLFFFIPEFFNIDVSPSKGTEENTIKVMTYNVRNFEVYSEKNSKQKRDAMIGLIKAQNADIVCLQEMIDGKNHIQLSRLATKLDMPYYYMQVGTQAYDRAKFGVAIFSKYKLINTTGYPFGSGGNVGARVEIDVNSDTISVFNMHLESANIDRSYYNYSKKDLDSISKSTFIQRAKIMSQQLKSAFKKRSSQANFIRNEIKNIQNPVLVCGDFNDTPISYAYSRIKGNLNDSFKKGGFGFGGTYPDLPFLRIDHILSSDEFSVENYRIIKKLISDHYPVISEVHLKEQKNN